jgi:hypothetical protein
MINERVLPNPFKSEGDHLDNVMNEIERELDEFNHAPFPEFLHDEFLRKLEADVMAASKKNVALKQQAFRIISKLHSHWPR